MLADSVSTSFQAFFSRSFSTGITIIVFSVIALLWANSPWSEFYEQLRHAPVRLTLPGLDLQFSFEQFVNDGLMALFFLLVGLEIKREILVGELSTTRKAMLPMIAALSGMIVPALIYLACNLGTPYARGWAVPVATDIAFALGILALLGPHVPTSLKVFLAALAIVDDLLSVVVIALFYSGPLSLLAFLPAVVVVALLVLCNRAGLYHMWIYVILGFALWICVIYSGLHPTIAGVLLALTIPSKARIHTDTFVRRATVLVERISEAVKSEEDKGLQMDAVHNLEIQCEKVQTPLHRMERGLNNPVSYIILPLFALVNAGIMISGDVIQSLTSSIGVGVILGLFLGKQIGVTLAVWVATRLGIADLPDDMTMWHVYGISLLCGIGFTMSLFVGQLAFLTSEDLDKAKFAIIVGSALSGLLGVIVLRRAMAKAEEAQGTL
ncbi:MAG: Na+/H+ antiporter NhaA [bacterium]|nr:Na+/H+ antiporter NhaA [bacterium]